MNADVKLINVVSGAGVGTCTNVTSAKALSACSVASNVIIFASLEISITSPCLTSVTGQLVINGFVIVVNTALTLVQLPALVYVGSSLMISNTLGLNAALSSIYLGSLTMVGTWLQIGWASTLTSLVLPSLAYVGQFFYVGVNSQITFVSMPVLTFVGSYFSVNTNPLLAVLAAPALQHIGSGNGFAWSVYLCLNLASMSFSPAIESAAAGEMCYLPQSCSTVSICRAQGPQNTCM